MFPARSGTRTSRSGGERTISHEGTANMDPPIQKGLVFVWHKNISWYFVYARTVHIKRKSYPRITKLGQKGFPQYSLWHHCKYDRLKTHGSLYSFFHFRNMLVCTCMWRIPQYYYSRHWRHNHVTRRYIRQHLKTKQKIRSAKGDL